MPTHSPGVAEIRTVKVHDTDRLHSASRVLLVVVWACLCLCVCVCVCVCCVVCNHVSQDLPQDSTREATVNTPRDIRDSGSVSHYFQEDCEPVAFAPWYNTTHQFVKKGATRMYDILTLERSVSPVGTGNNNVRRCSVCFNGSNRDAQTIASDVAPRTISLRHTALHLSHPNNPRAGAKSDAKLHVSFNLFASPNLIRSTTPDSSVT
jgi:hypothetical protein